MSATISAGSTSATRWLSNDAEDGSYPWFHPIGPVLTYLAHCLGKTCNGVAAKSLNWFKIDEASLLRGTVANGYWGSEIMIDDKSTWTSVIPKSVPSGAYLFRHETIALHAAPYGLKIYPECIQLKTINGSSLEPTEAERVIFSGAYSLSDPWLNISTF